MPRPVFDVDFNSGLSVLMFLSTALLLVLMAAAATYLAATRRRALFRKVLAGAGILIAGYLGTLTVFSLASHERDIGPDEAKYFCEIDCHLAYSILGVENTETLGPPPGQEAAQGTFHVITLKTWFDKRTISPHRGNGALQPNPRRVVIVDDQGREYPISPEGQRAFDQVHAGNTPLTERLRPGESYTTSLVFDLPASVRNPRLLISAADWVTHLLIGNENSFLHRKAFFRLEPQGTERSKTPASRPGGGHV